MSCVTFHMSGVPCHVLLVIFFCSFHFFRGDKVGELAGGGFVINEASNLFKIELRIFLISKYWPLFGQEVVSDLLCVKLKIKCVCKGRWDGTRCTLKNAVKTSLLWNWLCSALNRCLCTLHCIKPSLRQSVSNLYALRCYNFLTWPWVKKLASCGLGSNFTC